MPAKGVAMAARLASIHVGVFLNDRGGLWVMIVAGMARSYG